ncbi:STAS domain-containing protein [Nocardioides sp.]|uniref:STAS domain-containing protein n=1 Tax=Nocardioides sp. TaxID=35761 RepID=UPI003513A00A
MSTDGAVVMLHGDFDARSTHEVRDVVYDTLDRHRAVVVDLSDVRAVDVTALRLLAAATFVAHRAERRVTLRGCNGSVRRLLHRTHLIRLVHLDRATAC